MFCGNYTVAWECERKSMKGREKLEQKRLNRTGLV